MKYKMPYDDYLTDEVYLNCVKQDFMSFDYFIDAYKERVLHELGLLEGENENRSRT